MSPLDPDTQHVAYTDISIAFGSLSARSLELFGHIVPWDSVWLPGADSATRIAIDHDVVMEGHDVKAGEYSIWLIPREQGAWTAILSIVAHPTNNRYPGASKDYLRFDVAPEATFFVQPLVWYFSSVDKDEVTLRFHWGRTAVPIRIKAPYQP